jgi:hypothetical protein
MKPGVLEKVTARIVAGSAIRSFTKPGQVATFYDTILSTASIAATKDNNSKGQLRRWTRIRNNAVREESNDYYKIRATMPAGFPDKDDVISAIFEDLLTGALRRDDVKVRVQSYVAAHNRMFPTKYAMRSLDARIFHDGAMTLGDTITRGFWD